MGIVIIVGSSRTNGNTHQIVSKIRSITDWDVIDLNDYNIGYFDYEHKNIHDDYLDLMREIIKKYDTLIFATPVYWYAMSGIMKVFFDRFTDLLTVEKELGQYLRGKKMAALSCANKHNLGAAFWFPFQHTASYLGMEFIAGEHIISNAMPEHQLRDFIAKVAQ
jgi:multimeric flavodoxin WrbA